MNNFYILKCFILISHWQCRCNPSPLTYRVANNTFIKMFYFENPNLKSAEVSGSFDLLFLDPELDDLLLLKLLQLLLLGDEQVLLVGAGLLGHGVQDWGDGLKSKLTVLNSRIPVSV